MTDHALRTRANPPHRSLPYLLTFPALLALIGILYPFVLGVYYTFTNYTLTEPGNIRLVGLANYIEIFKNIDFWRALGLTELHRKTQGHGAGGRTDCFVQ